MAGQNPEMIQTPGAVSDHSDLHLDTRSPAERGERDLPALPLQQPLRGYPKYPRYDPTSKEAVVFSELPLPKRPAPIPWRQRKTLGLQRWRLLVLIGFLVAIAVTVAVVAVTLSRKDSTASVAPAASLGDGSNSTVNPVANPNLVNALDIATYDVVVDTQIAAYGSVVSAEDSATGVPVSHLYFQSAFGNVKEINQSIALENSTTAYSAVFDAMNGTGIAIFPYQNGSALQSSLIYVNQGNVLAEYRSYPGLYVADRWQPGPLTGLGITVPGSQTFGSNSTLARPQNGWDSTRMAAVYSANFSSGAGARLFIHGSGTAAGGSANFIQEVIWTQENDTWALGASLPGCVPQSHFSATIDPSSQTLRLFYTAAGNTVAEYYLNISDSGASYAAGVHVPNLLMNPSADISAASTSAGTYLYYAAAPADPTTAGPTIRELQLPSPYHQGSSPVLSASLSTPVISPNLLAPNPTNSTQLSSLYAPLTAVVSTAGSVEEITIFWAEDPVDPQGGYRSLKSLSRTNIESWADAAQAGSSTGSGGDSSGDGEGGVQSLPLGDLDCRDGRCTLPVA